MALTADQEALYGHAKSALPAWLFQSATAAQELLGAFAVLLDLTRQQVVEWLAQVYLLTSTGIWLDQHARDQGLSRQSAETDAALRQRLRFPPDAVTTPAIEQVVNAIQASAGFGDCTLLGLRKRRAHSCVDTVSGFHTAYASRGYRAGHCGRPPTLIVMLPYPTNTATADSVAEAVRVKQAAGYQHTIEVRANP